jgi:hypothetical protein
MSSKLNWKFSRFLFCAFCAFSWLLLFCGHVAAQSFIDDLQQRSFRYFWEQADPHTGLVPDRARMDGSPLPSSHQNVASIAATGFGLTSLCIAEDRGWVSKAEALERTRNTLRFFDARAYQQHGWKPESGFLRARWDTYSEDTILYLLAIASPTHPISPASWYALWRDRYRYEGYSYFTTIGVPLFMHQYSHAWIDFRNRRETKGDRIDYFQNSVAATLAHRAFCINLSHDFPAFGPDVWGITASDSAKGYLAWGGPPRDPDIDGTIVPSAPGGSLMFTPELSTRALETLHNRYGAKIYGRYGFVDAFNPQTGWTDTDIIGINAGIILLSAENMRTASIWRWFMANREIPVAVQRIGLQQSSVREARGSIPTQPQLASFAQRL